MKTRRKFLKQSATIACGCVVLPFALSAESTKQVYRKGERINICDIGAQGDGRFVNTKIINDAIATCSEHGGGTVVVPAGTFLSGTIRLQSGVSLFLEKGAVIKGIPDLNEYVPYIPSNEKGKVADIGKHNWNRALLWRWRK